MKGKIFVFVFLLSTFISILFANSISQKRVVTPQEIINIAESMKGGTYGWGVTDPTDKIFDCWSFVNWVYQTAFGYDQVHYLKYRNRADLIWIYFDNPTVLLPGDVLMNGGHHSVGFHGAIYVGNNMTMEARGRNYGIGSWNIKGYNKYAPYGQTGYRFCYYSLLARLWLYPHPNFAYVYLIPPSYIFSGESYNLKIHYYIPKSFSLVKYIIKIDVIDYIHPRHVLEIETSNNIAATGNRGIMNFTFKSKEAKFVFYRVELIDQNGKKVFEQETNVSPTQVWKVP